MSVRQPCVRNSGAATDGSGRIHFTPVILPHLLPVLYLKASRWVMGRARQGGCRLVSLAIGHLKRSGTTSMRSGRSAICGPVSGLYVAGRNLSGFAATHATASASRAHHYSRGLLDLCQFVSLRTALRLERGTEILFVYSQTLMECKHDLTSTFDPCSEPSRPSALRRLIPGSFPSFGHEACNSYPDNSLRSSRVQLQSHKGLAQTRRRVR